MKNIKKKGGRPLKKHAKLFPYIIFGFIFAVFITLKMSYKSDNKIVLQSEATVHKLKGTFVEIDCLSIIKTYFRNK